MSRDLIDISDVGVRVTRIYSVVTTPTYLRTVSQTITRVVVVLLTHPNWAQHIWFPYDDADNTLVLLLTVTQIMSVTSVY